MTTKPSSPLHRIFERGHKKVAFNQSKSRLLMQFSEQDHQRIAALIAKWLDESENKPARQGSKKR